MIGLGVGDFWGGVHLQFFSHLMVHLAEFTKILTIELHTCQLFLVCSCCLNWLGQLVTSCPCSRSSSAQQFNKFRIVDFETPSGNEGPTGVVGFAFVLEQGINAETKVV